MTPRSAPPPKKPSRIELRQISLDALVDERTLLKVLRGGTVKLLCMERIVRVLEQRGLLHLLSRPTDEVPTSTRPQA